AIPSSIPSYLLSEEDYRQVRSYDSSAKKIILTRILFTLSANESRFVELLKETIIEINKNKKVGELEIQSIKSDMEALRGTIGYKMLSEQDKDIEECQFRKKISQITESRNIIPLLAKKQILAREIDKVDLFRRKIQLLFQDPSFTAEQARKIETSVSEFFGKKSSRFDEVSPRVKLATEVNKLQDIEQQISDIENKISGGSNTQEYNAKLHKLKLLSGDIKENISKLNESIASVNENIREFQDKHFRMVLEIN
ncbi:putative Secreted Protein, partial [Cryptosporidium felis]